MVGCLIPAWLVYKVPALHKYKGMSLYLIIVTGLLLCVSPFPRHFLDLPEILRFFNMFDSTLNPLWQRYILAVQEEVKPALGCTEPISLALAAAVAAAELEGPVERVEALGFAKSDEERSGRHRSRHGNGGAADCGGAGGR